MGKILYLVSRFVSTLKPNSILYSKIDKRSNIGHGTQFVKSSIGKYSYLGNNCAIVNTKIGCFCSIGAETIIGGGSHNMNNVSTSPVFCKGRNVLRKHFSRFEYDPYKETFIGHDVWIGARVLIKGGVSIGTGSVIGMGSVVTKDVPPYAIVAGNPAKLIRYRFGEKIIRDLLESNWWDYSDKEIEKMSKSFNDVEAFIEFMRNNKNGFEKD